MRKELKMLKIEKITRKDGNFVKLQTSNSNENCDPEYDHPDDCNPGCNPDDVCSPDDDYNCSPDGDGLDCDPDGCLGDY